MTSRGQSWVKLGRNKSITNNACINVTEKYYNVHLNTKTINAAKQRSVVSQQFKAKPENSG